MSSYQRVMFIGGQENGTERTINTNHHEYRFMKVPDPILISLARCADIEPQDVTYEEIVYIIRQVGHHTYIAILKELL